MYSNYKQLGRFTLRDGGNTVAAGIVTELGSIKSKSNSNNNNNNNNNKTIINNVNKLVLSTDSIKEKQ